MFQRSTLNLHFVKYIGSDSKVAKDSKLIVEENFTL